MAKFLSAGEILKSIKTLINKSTKIDLAVAYWGNGALQMTALDQIHQTTKVRIICDLESGACNPDVIRQLIKKRFQVRSLKSLHAKVYIGEKSLIVGSANASSNGLASEGVDTNGMHEAAALITEESTLTAANQWFSRDLWPTAKPISRAALKAATLTWENRSITPKPILPSKKPILLSELFKKRDFQFLEKNIFVVFYHQELNSKEIVDGDTYLINTLKNLNDYAYYVYYRAEHDKAIKRKSGWYVFVRDLKHTALIDGIGKVEFDIAALNILKNAARSAKKLPNDDIYTLNDFLSLI